jgi:DNA repair exonuclease SbcCD ATPase subunit
MPRETPPNGVRAANLKRRFRGYDRRQTNELLAKAATIYERLRAERDALAERLEHLQRERDEAAQRARTGLAELERRLKTSERHVRELESQLGDREAELDSARIAQRAQGAELTEQREIVAGLQVRERALAEQLAALKGQLAQEAIEVLERETRRLAELTLEKARERAEEILAAAHARRREIEAHAGAADEADRDEFDPLAAVEAVASVQEPEGAQEIGEAMWTSRGPVDES